MALVLVVEDAALTAYEIAQIIEQEGHRVLGPVGSVQRAMKLLENEWPDLALLDVNLGDERVEPVADALADHDTPFVFITAYERDNIAPRHSSRRIVPKPFDYRDLAKIISDAASK